MIQKSWVLNIPFIMKSIKKLLTIVVLTILSSSCSNQQSLQKYFVDNSGNPDFISATIPANIISLNDVNLSVEQKQAYESVKKLNVLAFQLKDNNKLAFETEKNKVKAILQNNQYQELMRMNSRGYGGVVKYLGDNETIDEVIIYGNSNEKGFALIRILGDNMTPDGMLQLMQAVQNGKISGEGLDKFDQFFK